METTGSLYFHFPFCTKKCPYCHFYVIPAKDFHKKIFLEAIEKEWNSIKKKLSHVKIQSLYFGGGTPSLFCEGIEKVLTWVQEEKLSFSPDLEITVEANPESVEKKAFISLQKKGINRVSLGVQSLQNSLLSVLQRDHCTQEVLQALQILQECNLTNISIDLMYDLPTQKRKDFQKCLQQAVRLPITHISLYNLSIEPHTYFYKYQKKYQKALPKESESLYMYQDAISILSDAGFMQYEISAFCKKGYASKHNLGYWTGRPFLGLGPSASSFWKNTRYKNLSHILRYHRKLQLDESPIEVIDELPPLEREKELFCLGLRLLQGTRLSNYIHLSNNTPFLEKLTALQNQGLVEKKENKIRLTQKGILLHDGIAAELI